MENLSIDIETYSDVDLTKCGVYRYAESDAFEILLFAYSADEGSVTVIDMTQTANLPAWLENAIVDPKVKKWAYNANFERVCLSQWLLGKGRYLEPESWYCDMVWAATLGLPGSLKTVGEALKIENQKMAEGADLIRYFCKPCKPTKTNGGRIRNYPEHALDKWETFVKYNRRDVEAELAIHKRLMPYPVSELIWKEYHQDQAINDRGVLLDQDLIRSAIKIDRSTSAQLKDEMKAITGLDNPGSVTQLKGWLAGHGVEATTLGKKAVLALIDQTHGDVQKVLKLRQISAKSSVKKYEAMKRSVNADHRARGLFQFFGAPRTGRFAGRRIQLQNLPQNHIPDLAEARQLVRDGDADMVAALYENVPDTLSQLLRTALIPKPGFKFIVSDFSAIEARVLSWIAGEKWRMEVFAENGDIYCASASQMFGVPVVKHGVNRELRQKGKIAELALGYGGSVGALKSMGALEMGLSEDELPGLVRSWRKTNPKIVDFWWQVDGAVKDTLRTGQVNSVKNTGITTRYDGAYLEIMLPSGRNLFYLSPAFGENKFGGECITYMGLDAARHWSRVNSYGPKFVENIIQGLARDILCAAMLRMRTLRIVGHVHDEVIIEAPKSLEVETINQIMAETPSWAPGLVLNADGYECHFYQKD